MKVQIVMRTSFRQCLYRKTRFQQFNMAPRFILSRTRELKALREQIKPFVAESGDCDWDIDPCFIENLIALCSLYESLIRHGNGEGQK